MSDTTTDTNRPPPDATPEQLASARATWIAAGHDPTVYDRATGYVAPAAAAAPAPPATAIPAPDAPAPAVTTDPSPAAGQAGTGTEPLSDEAMNALADNLRHQGVSEAVILAAWKDHGFLPEERTPEQVEWDRNHGFEKHHEPADYKIDLQAAGLYREYGQDTAGLAQSQAEWRGLMSAFQVSPALGAYLVQHAILEGKPRASWDEGQRSLWLAEQEQAGLRHAGSPEALQALRNDVGHAVKVALDQGADPAAIDALRASGFFSDHYVMRLLALHGSNLREWAAGPKRA